jgi:rhamnogalacturonyl hydrolase YesR
VIPGVLAAVAAHRPADASTPLNFTAPARDGRRRNDSPLFTTMGFYFEDHQSMFAVAGLQVEKTLDAIVHRYRGQHPPHAPTFRPYQRRGILRGPDSRYHADFNREFPKAPDGAFVYTWARIWAQTDSELKFDVSCACPTVIYRNQQCVFRSTIFEERYPEKRHTLHISLQAGWNHFVVRFRKTRAGFGGVFGTWLGKLPYYFLKPAPERAGEEGWLFTAPLTSELPMIPGAATNPADFGATWLPENQWEKSARAFAQCRRIFGPATNACAFGWTRASFMKAGAARYVVRGSCRGPISITIGDAEVFTTRKAGALSAEFTASSGDQDLMVRAESRDGDWGFELKIEDDAGVPVRFSSPCNLAAPQHVWIYLGLLPVNGTPSLRALRDLYQVTPGMDGDVYWRVDAPDTWVRPYNDNPLYGRWNYPLGVTLYGLLQSAHELGSSEIQDYVVNHVRFCCHVFHYALWDRAQHGGATNVHHLLTSIDSLDDCGSFGSCVLEVAQRFDIPGVREIADYVANYIEHEQVRLPDGTFFRKDLMHHFHEDTLWADDLYMSVPFLCRYFQLTGEARYIDDAARQFIGFKKLLYLPERKIMSHVYDFSRQLATGVPWGRGNGWVIFSLAELLTILPESHELRPTLLEFFRQLCAGYLVLQGETGMWHQVLTEPDSYPETSCTSMFAYAFARGVRKGWLSKTEPYVRAVSRAWEALNRQAIDWQGNVHGVCRGSEFSFTSEYYKKDLLWNLNDTHGIGIVLLAGVEVLRLREFLATVETVESAKSPAPVRRRKLTHGRAARRSKIAAAAK